MRHLALTLTLLALSFGTLAQGGGLNDNDAKSAIDKVRKREKAEQKDTTYWDRGGVITLDFSNVFLSNWAGGGLNSVSGKGLISLYAKLVKKNSTWDNTLDLGYGLVNQFDTDPLDNVDDGLFYKSDDRIDFASKYGRHAFQDWYYSGLLNFRSQFAPGFANPADSKDINKKISDFAAPAYVIAAVGLDYKPNKHFTLFLSPLTSKTTIVADDTLSSRGAFGVDKGEMIRFEVGGYVKAAYNKKLFENKNDKGAVTESMTFSTKIDLFSNYIENPQNIDVSWETLISMQFLKYFSFTTGTHLIYDDDIDSKLIVTERDPSTGAIVTSRLAPGVQFKWVTGIGFVYKF